MNYYLFVLLISIFFISQINGAMLPPYIDPCRITDPKLSECVSKVAQEALRNFSRGIPYLDVPSMDPAMLDLIQIDVPGLNVVYNNTILTGIGSGRIENLKINLKKNTMKFDFVGDVTLRGQYKVRGRVLILPIVGEGDYSNIIKNLRMKTKYNLLQIQSPEGYKYWRMEIAKNTFTVGGAHFDFKNLFGGNRLLGDTTLRFLNENWQPIMNDIAPSAINQISTICTETANKFFRMFPADELVLP